MSAIAAGIAVLIWHFRRSHRNWHGRKADYTWVFLQGGVAYVMTVFLIGHFCYGIAYTSMLSNDFGTTQISVAFAAALWESLKSLWDMWRGNGDAPSEI